MEAPGVESMGCFQASTLTGDVCPQTCTGNRTKIVVLFAVYVMVALGRSRSILFHN